MLRRHTISVKHAIDGIVWAFTTQPNYRIHFFLSFLSLISGIFLQISYYEWLTIIILVFIGLTIETINTAIEKVCDAVDRTYNEHIKIAKDVAAGAMLLFAMGAIVCAYIIFIPKLILLIM